MNKPTKKITLNRPERTAAPRLVLNNTDRFYLAVVRKRSDRLTFVYTLACLNNGGNQYRMVPETEIATFDKPADADIYYNTVKELMNFQHSSDGGQMIADSMTAEIKLFNQRVR